MAEIRATHIPYKVVSSATKGNINELRETLARLVPEKTAPFPICADLIRPGDFVVLVIPIDKAAPKGRLILPEQQTIRDILDAGAVSLVTREDKLAETLEKLLGMLGGGLNGGAALTPDGNLSLIDDIGSPTTSGKQFITVETKNGNVFYLIIDRDDEGEETVHFLNQVDEADLMALTEDGEKAETPIVCTCTEKCQAGAVNTACPVCVKNLSECVGTEQKAAEPTEPENPEPEKKSNAGAILAVLLILAAGGGAAVYFLVLKPKQGKKVPADLDDFDLEDEEEYLTEDEETEEKNE